MLYRLVTDRRAGRWVHYALNRAAFGEVQELLGDMKPAARRLTVRDADCC